MKNKSLHAITAFFLFLFGLFFWLKYGLILDYGTPEKIVDSHAQILFYFGVALFAVALGYFLLSSFQFFVWLVNKIFPKGE
jgi:hypothetical protein